MKHTRKFLEFVFQKGSYVELRAFIPDGTPISGCFDDMARMANMGAILSDDPNWGWFAAGVYFTLNTIRADRAKFIGAREMNGIKPHARAARNEDIEGRNLYLIDIDPVRPSGVSSTDAEKAEAFAVADRVAAFLREKEWPEPILVDSGNGAHLLYRGDSCNASSQAWNFLLKALATRFDTEGAHIDTVVGNAARISRLPGTWNRKGDSTEQRPHRRARVLKYPERWEPVNHGVHVYRVAANLGYAVDSPAQTRTANNSRCLVEDVETQVENFIEEYPEVLELDLVITRGALKYYVLLTCPFAGYRHQGDPNKAAIVLGDTAVGFKCMSSDCEGKGMKELRDLLFRETGRRSATRFYEGPDSTEQVFNKELERHYREMSRTVAERTDVRYDMWTWNAVESGLVEKMDAGTNPKDWGLNLEDVITPFRITATRELNALSGDARESFRQSMLKIVLDKDSASIGELLGKEQLFWISREVQRPVTPAKFIEIMDGDCPEVILAREMEEAQRAFSNPES